MIIQGGNTPIILRFNSSIVNVYEISCTLVSYKGKVLKEWKKKDMTISQNEAECPITQQESVHFPVGTCQIEVKWKETANDVVAFNKIHEDEIVLRRDKDII